MPGWDRPNEDDGTERPKTPEQRAREADAEWERNRYGPDGSDRADIAARAAKDPGKWERESEPLSEAEAAELARPGTEDLARNRSAAVGHAEGATDPGRLRDLARVFRREKDGSATADQSPADQAEQAEQAPADRETAEKEQAERELAKELAEEIDKETNREIDRVLDHLNPKYDPTKSAYKENCTGVVQAYELQRRGQDVQPGPLEKHLRSDDGGSGGRWPESVEQTWGRKFVPGTQAEIEAAFHQPGARGVVLVKWHQYLGGGGHVFNVENVGGNVRFIDGQRNPPVSDASRYFSMGHGTSYIRLDDLSEPSRRAVRPYLEP